MLTRRITFLLVGATLTVLAALAVRSPSLSAETLRCTMRPGATLAVMRVERDTVLRLGKVIPGTFLSASGVPPGAHDTLLANEATEMPAARATLLRMDSTTRASLAAGGITDPQPVVFVRAEPYRADCYTTRWTDTVPFVVRGDVGYLRASLTPRDHWIGGVPLFVVRDAWFYPYPYRRTLAFGMARDVPLAPAEAMFSLDSTLNVRDVRSGANDSAGRARALAWMRANPEVADLEPARTFARRSLLNFDWANASRAPSRLRGTYRVEIELDDARDVWYFRTHDRPGYSWSGPGRGMTTAELVASPHVAGYRLVGYAARSQDSLPTESPRIPHAPLAWLASTDRPTAPENDERRTLAGVLEFRLANATEKLWDVLEMFVPRMSALDSTMLARMNRQRPRGDKQPQLPIRLHLDGKDVRADTILNASGRRLRVRLERIDTLAIRRPWG